MRIHTHLAENVVRQCLSDAIKLEKVHPMVSADIEEHGSRSHTRAFEVHLQFLGEKVKNDGRRLTNSGHWGAGSSLSATWDEWGWFLSHLFEADPRARAGQNLYNNRDDFHTRTGDAYRVRASL